MNRRDRAFTLIELLVCIAIMAILSAIVMPAYITAIDRANQETCKARLRVVALASRAYFDEHGEHAKSLRQLYNGGYVDDELDLRCKRTGKPYVYARPSATADRATIFLSCVATGTRKGQRPHFYGDAFIFARLSGRVESQRQ